MASANLQELLAIRNRFSRSSGLKLNRISDIRALALPFGFFDSFLMSAHFVFGLLQNRFMRRLEMPAIMPLLVKVSYSSNKRPL